MMTKIWVKLMTLNFYQETFLKDRRHLLCKFISALNYFEDSVRIVLMKLIFIK